MIQTQLLRLDPPYQIISAGGRVGIQVATLIVTEDKTTEDGLYTVDIHSHPVVNYGLKQGVEEELKYNGGLPDYERYDKITCRLQPEGAVWNKVEVGDVHVLGLAGANNDMISLWQFVSLVPASPLLKGIPVWDLQSVQRMYNLTSNLKKVGLKLSKTETGLPIDRDRNLNVRFELIYGTANLVCVVIKEEEENPIRDEDYGVKFYVEFTKDTNLCENLIISVMRELQLHFFPSVGLTFYHIKYKARLFEKIAKGLEKDLNAASLPKNVF